VPGFKPRAAPGPWSPATVSTTETSSTTLTVSAFPIFEESATTRFSHAADASVKPRGRRSNEYQSKTKID
jgi:hypothetical protein